MDALAFAHVEHFDGVIAQRADEQSFACGVEIEVIDPPFYSRQRDRLLELKPRTSFSGGEMIAVYSEENSGRKPGQRRNEQRFI
jgi:hypothetical protein